MRVCASPLKLSETPGEVYAPAPMLGEHSEQVLREVLGYSREKVAQLKEEGVINKAV
jgi:crotonobetainyl-CoA:carnitine CoA-transferase CaiB-like acyl-CoA transferase